MFMSLDTQANDTHRQYIVQFVLANMTMLKRYTFAKHIIARVEKTFKGGM